MKKFKFENMPRSVDKLNWRVLIIFLSLVYVLTLLGFIIIWRIYGFTWLGIILVLIILFASTELVSMVLLQRFYPTIWSRGKEEFRMKPNIFAHFIPSSQYDDINADGFRITKRITNANSSISKNKNRLIYLAGDCIAFEIHLPPEETFAYQLNTILEGFDILNAGCEHYTALHSYNRFVIDVVKGYKPDIVVFLSAVNDVLSFIHHKNKVVNPDHTHMYKAWVSNPDIYGKLSKLPSSTLKLLLFFLLFDKRMSTWDRLAEELSMNNDRISNAKTARELFDPTFFINCLKLFESTCKAIDAQFILTTYYYNENDMREEPRRTYAWGVDILNQKIREFAKTNSIKIIDFAKELSLSNKEIYNKWHYTKLGNLKRAHLVSKKLNKWWKKYSK